MSESTHGFGWKPDIPDHRDHLFAAPPPTAPLPPAVDLRPQCPPVRDQGALGACTSFAIGSAIEFDRAKQGLPAMTPSHLFLYWNERVVEGTVESDAGAMIRDGIKSVAHQGVCPESMWPYDPRVFTYKPGPECYLEAAKHTAVAYQRVARTLPQMRGCLAAGYPFVAGISVYETFESRTMAGTGFGTMPRRGEALIGGHAVLCVGYSDETKRFLFQNSWGSWGDGGFFSLPYPYLTHRGYAGDLWTIRLLQEAAP